MKTERRSLASGARRAGLAAAGFFAGCAAPGDAPPPAQRAAARQAQRGEVAYLAGRPAEAVPALREAVRLKLTAGDLPGVARGLINLALAQRAARDAAGAAESAARLRELAAAAGQQAGELEGKNSAAGAEFAVAAGWLEALLALDRGDPAAAAGLLGATPPGLPSSSPWPGRLANVRAEIDLAGGHPTGALAHTRVALAACAAARDRAEEARAHRLAGAAHVRLAQWAEAGTQYLAAVEIEGRLGAGERLARDLGQLAVIAEKSGDAAAARLYAARARLLAPTP